MTGDLKAWSFARGGAKCLICVTLGAPTVTLAQCRAGPCPVEDEDVRVGTLDSFSRVAELVASMPPRKKKKETDYEALSSSFMRVPKMSVEAARALLALGLKQLYELEGRSPESLFEDYKKLRPDADKETLAYFRLAVYCAENDSPEPAMLELSVWRQGA